MGKKILIAVANCAYSQQVVRYVARMTSEAKNIAYAVFNVQPLLPLIIHERAKTDPDVKREAEDLVGLSSEAAHQLVQDMKALMVNEGIDKKRIDTFTSPMEVGMAKDILNKAESGSFDAIVMGRQGPTPTKGCYIGTTAAKIVEHALSIPVWLVSGDLHSMRILMAVDGSEMSFKMVDHLGHIVGPHPSLQLTLFHVPMDLKYCSAAIATGKAFDVGIEKPSLQRVLRDEDTRRMDSFYKRAFEILKSAGIKKSQIEIKTRVWGHDVSSAILDEAQAGKHSTIMVARRGTRKAFFSGQIAMRLLQKLSDRTLWIIA